MLIMSARRIARELAIIVMPQLPKDKHKLTELEIDVLVAKAVHMLADYAKQNLKDANALLTRLYQAVTDIEVEHPNNTENIDIIEPVPLTTDQLKEQIEHVERALNLVAEALDIPDLCLNNSGMIAHFNCKECGAANDAFFERPDKTDVRNFVHTLISAYLDHKSEIDQLIKQAKAKWQIERMVSIDRDILRLACAEAFYVPQVPVNVCISEAVELSHRFADEKAVKFINGVLGDLAQEAKRFRLKGTLLNQPEQSAGDDIQTEALQNSS